MVSISIVFPREITANLTSSNYIQHLSNGLGSKMDLPLTVMLPAVRGTPTRVTGYRPDSAGRDSAAGRDSNSTPEVSKP